MTGGSLRRQGGSKTPCSWLYSAVFLTHRSALGSACICMLKKAGIPGSSLFAFQEMKT